MMEFLAQSALRVLQGQLPHRDFVEKFIRAASASFMPQPFRVFGVNLLSLRICGVFYSFWPWVPALYSVALRFTPPLAAGIIAFVGDCLELSKL